PLLDARRAPQSLAAISRSNRAALLPSRLPDTFEKANRVPPGSLRKRFIPLRVVRSSRVASPRRPFLRVKRADRLIVSLFILTSTRFLLAAGAQARRKTTHLLAKKSQTCCRLA